MFVAITGASGFLGSHTLAALRRAGHRVRALSRTRDEAIDDDADEWCIGDQYDHKMQAQFVDGADAVIHAAIDWSALNEGPLPNLDVNLTGTLRLSESARAAGVHQFLFVSSLEVYFQSPRIGALTEADAVWPASIYGAFKASVELHLKAYHASYGMSASAWRPASMYGPHPTFENTQWLDLIRRVARGETIADATAVHMVHVQDVAEALALAIGDESTAGEFFNLVDVPVTWDSVARVAADLTTSSARIEAHSSAPTPPAFDASKAIEFCERHGNHTALRRGLEGVRQHVRWVWESLQRDGSLDRRTQTAEGLHE